jgi:hypothetical protein
LKSSEETIMNRMIFALAFFSLTLPAFGQGVDPLIGTWKLNLEKSTSTGPMAKSEILHWTGEGQTFVDNADTVDANGRAYHTVYMHIYDGKPHPTTGNPDVDSSTYNRIGNVLSIARFKNGKQVSVAQAVIDPGKTYTITTGGIINGQPFFSVGVYDRQ